MRNSPGLVCLAGGCDFDDELAGFCGFVVDVGLGIGVGCAAMSRLSSESEGSMVIRASMTEMRKSEGPGLVLRKCGPGR